MALESPDPDHLWQWLLSLAVVMWIIKLCLDTWRTHMRTPDPVPPLHERYATKMDHRELGSKVQRLEDRTEARFEKLASASSDSRKVIYQSIRELEKQTAGLSEKSSEQSAQLSRLDSKMDRLIEKVSEQKGQS